MTPPSETGTAVDGLALRPFDPGRDYGPVADLVCRTNLFDGQDWLLSETALRGEVGVGRRYDPTADARVAERAGEPLGFVRVQAHVRDGKMVHRAELWTDPAWRRRGIGRALLAWVEQRAADQKASGIIGQPVLEHEVGLTGDLANVAAPAFAAACGYRQVRRQLEMQRALARPIAEAPLPEGLELRPVREADVRAIWDATQEAFRDHWEAATRTDADFQHFLADPDRDTALWRVAWDGDQVAGASLNAIYTEENERLGIKAGWLEQVSVRRPWRRSGLGAAIVAASLRAFRDRGLDRAALGVDAENPTGALALYERLGFVTVRAFGNFRKAI
jgi:mycothiol synthase